MNGKITEHPRLNVLFPEQAVFLRLGGNLTKTAFGETERRKFLTVALRAFDLCRPAGRWTVLPVKQVLPGSILLADGTEIPGGDFAGRCGGISHLWCGAVTAGAAVTAARDELSSVAERAVYDAVGAECADAAMDTLQELSRQMLLRQALGMAERRFSPGYGDMPLSVQRFFFEKLRLEELSMSLGENLFITPEKSVTAFSGVKNC